MIKSYRELLRLKTFEERFEYLKLEGIVGRATFGFDRYVNQLLYHSKEWKLTRRDVIVRDKGCDLGISDREIFSGLVVHHINPVSLEAIERGDDRVFDLDNLICTSLHTHNAIHYGRSLLLKPLPQERTKGDTNLWETQKAY